jgi:hypothetical protein
LNAPTCFDIPYLGVIVLIDIKALRLRRHPLELRWHVDGLHLDREAEILGGLLADLLDHSPRAADMDQRDVLDTLCPDGWEPTHRAGSDRCAGDGGHCPEKLPT